MIMRNSAPLVGCAAKRGASCQVESPGSAHCCEGAWAIIVPAAVPSTEFEEERYSTVIAGSPMRPSTVTPHCESPHSVWRVAPSGSVMVTRSFTVPGGCWVAMLTRRVCGASGPPTR